MVTLMGMFCGFYAIVASMRDEYHMAAIAVIVAAVFDALDGKVARLLNATSRFGMELDSLSDLVSFGVAPAVLLYMWALEPFGRIGWVAAFVMVACAALRLARFNLSADGASAYFSGMPTPAAACIVASFVIFYNHLMPGEGAPFGIYIVLLGYLLAFLMVSNIRYYSFKDIRHLRRKPFGLLVLILLLFAVIGSYPEVMIFVMAIAYLASGPVGYLISKRKKQDGDRDEQKNYGV
ncbi:CDP-diacylglycerol--serine O-phosphatidyltransferase [Desulfurispira natronophila]|nr:CDP-diacylglycerol--serine O-phosphatidyltransferase [Desulfurispira natronophila]